MAHRSVLLLAVPLDAPETLLERSARLRRESRKIRLASRKLRSLSLELRLLCHELPDGRRHVVHELARRAIQCCRDLRWVTGLAPFDSD